MIEKIDFEIRRIAFRALGRAGGAFNLGMGLTAILAAARSANPHPMAAGETALFWFVFIGLIIGGVLGMFGAAGHFADTMNEYRSPQYDPDAAAEMTRWVRSRQRVVVWCAVALLVGAWFPPFVAIATVLIVTLRMAMLELAEGKIRKRLLVRVVK